MDAQHRSSEELEAGLDAIRGSPADLGPVELIVRRPAVDSREELASCELDVVLGLVGDTWRARPSRTSSDGGPHPDKQLTLVNARVVACLADDRSRWSLAGDQLYVDLDLGLANLPAGTELALGTAIVAVTDSPHTGCAKFSQRFGAAALRFVNSAAGRELRLRGLNARVVRSGTVRLGDVVRKL